MEPITDSWHQTFKSQLKLMWDIIIVAIAQNAILGVYALATP